MRFAEQNAARTGPLEDGSTGTTVLLLRNHLYIAHTGDSRAILCSNNTLFELTRDHRPDDPKELERYFPPPFLLSPRSLTLLLSRITSHGGSVVGGRVAGKLGVSRSFGDYTFKKNGVLVVDPGLLLLSILSRSLFPFDFVL
jgi:serine/threonine protein phosphatase PrpC